jgi:hypothetical protein
MISIKSAKVTLYFFLLGLPLHAQTDIHNEIKTAIKIGSAKELAVFFKDGIEITILDQKNVYKKSDAEIAIKKFFNMYPVTDFVVIHQGTSKEGLKYMIGHYKHAKGIFQTVIFLKIRSGEYVIDTLQFNED